MDAFDRETARKLKWAGTSHESIEVNYNDCLKVMRKVTAEQVGNLKEADPSASAEQLRSIVIKAMRTALDIAPGAIDGWLMEQVKRETAAGSEEPDQVTLTTLMFCRMVSMIRDTFGLDTSDSMVQENLMIQIQRALDAKRPPA